MLQIVLSPFPEIRTPRLLLRASTPADADALFNLRSDEAVMKYIGRPKPKSIEDILQLIEVIQNRVATNEGIEWAITLQSTGGHIGTISFHRLIKEHYRAEVGYMLHPAYQRMGIMSEALNAVVAHGFNTMGLHSIEAQLDPNNIASAKLLEANGFVREGLFKENHYWNGRFNDTAVYSLLRIGH